MAHEFPKELTRNNFGRDPEVLNERFRRLAGEIGDLNEHDLKASLITLPTMAASCVHSLSQVRTVANPDFRGGGASGNYADPFFDADTLHVSDDVGWTTLSSTTLSTGEDTLYIVGQFTYAGFDGDATSVTYLPDPFCVRAQFALEVDGTVIEDTITGHADPLFVGINMVYRTDHVDVPADVWDFRHLERLPELGGMNKNFASGRIIFSVDVGEGSHTVRLLARRCPRTETLPEGVAAPVAFADCTKDKEGLYYRNKYLPTTKYPESYRPELYVFNRQLHVIKQGGWQKAGDTTQSSFSPSDLQDGDVFSETALETNRITAAANVINALQHGDLARGSLRAEHLPSISTSGQNDTTVDITVNTEYTGFENTVGDNLLSVACSINPATDTGFVLITADVEVRDINVAAGFELDCGLFIGKLVAVGTSGTLYPLASSEAYCSSDVLQPDAALAWGGGHLDGTIAEPWDNMSLTWCGSVNSFSETITAFRIYGCVWDAAGGAASTPSAEIKRRHINFVHFKK